MKTFFAPLHPFILCLRLNPRCQSQNLATPDGVGRSSIRPAEEQRATFAGTLSYFRDLTLGLAGALCFRSGF